jgi:hypothetical protein
MLRNIFTFSRKTFFNPSGWLGVDNLKTMNTNLVEVVKPLYQKPLVVREETFENAMQRLGLDETDIQHGAKNYRSYAFGFLLFGLITFTYSFYLLFSHGSFTGWIIGFSVTALFISQAFKYDFWAMQMRQRRLGITVQEWLDNILGSKKGSSR